MRVLRDSAILVAASAVIALASNALRSNGLPLVQRKDYEILVPCKEVSGQVTAIAPSDPAVANPSSLLIDARSKREFETWHLAAAINIPFDYLASTSEAEVKRVMASRAARVVIYGDGKNPDCGHELGTELSGKGIRNVLVVTGGAPALGGPADPKEAP